VLTNRTDPRFSKETLLHNQVTGKIGLKLFVADRSAKVQIFTGLNQRLTTLCDGLKMDVAGA